MLGYICDVWLHFDIFAMIGYNWAPLDICGYMWVYIDVDVDFGIYSWKYIYKYIHIWEDTVGDGYIYTHTYTTAIYV